MLKRLGNICLSLCVMSLHLSIFIYMKVVIIIGVVKADMLIVVFAVISTLFFQTILSILVYFNLLDPKTSFLKYARLLVNSCNAKQKTPEQSKEELNAKIEIIYRKNIFSLTNTLRVSIDGAKWPFVNFVCKKPLVILTTSGKHVINLSDGSLARHDCLCDIMTSPAYCVRLTFFSRQIFLYRRGEVLIEHVIVDSEC